MVAGLTGWELLNTAVLTGLLVFFGMDLIEMAIIYPVFATGRRIWWRIKGNKLLRKADRDFYRQVRAYLAQADYYEYKHRELVRQGR